VKLPITVLYTTQAQTKSALQEADRLARNLGATIQMMMLRVVPFPLELNHPPVPMAIDRRFARRVARSAGVDTEVRVYECRDAEETLLRMLPEHSIVVIGCRWTSRHWHLIRTLKRNGHDPVLVH
jgi:hypothetical protein